MLAQSFKSADELGITEPQRDALMKTLVLLETGKLRHVPIYDDGGDLIDQIRHVVPLKARRFSYDFNMAEWSHPHSCGTVCCIGGTAEFVGGLELLSFDHGAPAALKNLFYPGSLRLSEITPAQAATALRSYLTTGDAKWREAVSGG